MCGVVWCVGGGVWCVGGGGCVWCVWGMWVSVGGGCVRGVCRRWGYECLVWGVNQGVDVWVSGRLYSCVLIYKYIYKVL